MSVRSRTLAFVALAVIALTLVACGGDDKKQEDASRAASVNGLPSATATTAARARGESSPAPSGVPAASASAAPAGIQPPKVGAVLARVVVPAIQMDAEVETKSINVRGEMEDPSGKDHAAWYDFSEFPGFGGNAVFSGHVDWFTGELGVFGRMRDLKDGDEIVLRLSDGMDMTYKVSSSILYESAKAPVGEITGRTAKDSLTFITCEGAFSRSAQDYSHRRVVRAERVA